MAEGPVEIIVTGEPSVVEVVALGNGWLWGEGVGNISNQIDLLALLALKRDFAPRVLSISSSATPTPNCDTTDQLNITALAASPTFAVPVGTPVDGQKLIVRIKDNGTARPLTFNAVYRFTPDLPAPLTTVVNKNMYLGFIYNAADVKWDCIAFIDNF